MAVGILLVVPIKIRAIWVPGRQEIAVRYLGFGHTTDFAAGVNIIDWLGLRLFRSGIGPGTDIKQRKFRAGIEAKTGKFDLSFSRLAIVLVAHRRTISRTIARMLVWAGRLLLSPRVCRLHVDIAAGCGDPAVTGMYYGWYHAVRQVWASERVMVNWQPVFDRAHFATSLDGLVWLRPWRPVLGTIRLLHELPKRGLYRLYRDLKRRRSE